MNWNEFKSNVERWAEERGIYEHSTPEAQLLKALSELGELADAVVKNDRDALKDAIGDVVVCLINCAKMIGEYITKPNSDEHPSAGTKMLTGILSIYIGGQIMTVSDGLKPGREIYIDRTLRVLDDICKNEGTTFMHCCHHAWLQIKDRKGRMVEGGAFVKEPEQ